jgi:hypothetical protein
MGGDYRLTTRKISAKCVKEHHMAPQTLPQSALAILAVIAFYLDAPPPVPAKNSRRTIALTCFASPVAVPSLNYQ